MGVVNHNAVLATTWKQEEAARLSEWINDTLPIGQRNLFAVNRSPVNDYWTICLFPDGSNEGWPESDAGDSLRAAFVAEIRRGDYPIEEGQAEPSSPWDYVEVGFGEFGAAVLTTNCSNHFGDEPYYVEEEQSA